MKIIWKIVWLTSLINAIFAFILSLWMTGNLGQILLGLWTGLRGAGITFALTFLASILAFKFAKK